MRVLELKRCVLSMAGTHCQQIGWDALNFRPARASVSCVPPLCRANSGYVPQSKLLLHLHQFQKLLALWPGSPVDKHFDPKP
jgi:hypothetical protein